VTGIGPAQYEVMVEKLMSKPFSTCLLVQDGSKAPEFVVTEVNLHPGSRFSAVDPGKVILLAGGFCSITPESGFPLSPTLQLNYDLASFDTEELSAIARAELRRNNAVNYRSYTVETDNRVCVVGDSVGQLDSFIGIYGGVLDITPLLVKGFHPDVPTALELHIDNNGNKSRLEYQLRSPVDFDLCTYCGECGPVCPEQCISETLFVNYDTCTFCKECEKVCGAKAIDVHGAVRTAIEVPALIILGKSDLGLPAGIRNVYYEDNLSEYFAALFPCQIDEVVTCDSGLCQYNGNLGRGCDLCLSSCPHGAIAQGSKGVTVDSFKCEECGACVAVCPTGALQNERFNDASFVDYFREVILPQDGTVVIGHEKSLHNLWWRQQGKRYQDIFFLQYSTVHSLSLFHFMFLLSRGARRIVVVQNENQQRGTAASGKQIDLANEMLTRLFDIEDAVSVCRVEDFDGLAALAPVGSLGSVQLKDRFINRRQSLATALEVLVTNSGRETTMRPEGYIPFATVSCNTERCTQCMACLNDCRIAAMRADQQQLTLNHLAALCVGCGLCVHICPENALSISSEFTLNNDFFAPVELAKAEPMACKSCGKVFGTRKTFDRVMAILSKKESVDTSHFEYCETCRVVKLFETK
jgi:ferredoxin